MPTTVNPSLRRLALLVLSVGAASGLVGCGASSPASLSPVVAASQLPGSPVPSPVPNQMADLAATATARPPGLIVATSRVRLPSPLSRTVAFSVGTAVLVCGGLTPAGTTGAILRLSLPAGPVTVAGRLAAPVHDAAGAWLSGSILVIGGGRTTQDAVVQRVLSSGRASVIGRLPAPRADLASISVGDALIVLGGGAGGRPDPRVLSTSDGIHYRVVATLPVGVRYAAVAQVNGRIFVLGGTSASGDVTAIQVVDLAHGSARIVGRLPRSVSHATAIVIDGRLFIAGGRHLGRPLDSIDALDPGTFTLTSVGHLPRPLSDAAAVVVAGIGYLIGGEAAGPSATIVSLTPH